MSVRRILLVVATVMLTSVAFAQERCASDIFQKRALQKNPEFRSRFESWMKKKLQARRSQDQSGRTSTTYKIPVVVHILHNGEAVGTGINIPDAQVLSQIRVLNEDYQRLNADRVNTPEEFAPVASSIDLEFVLAKQDPDGLPTTGITRTLAGQNGYTINDDVEIKSQIYWPSENYLNIWIVNLTDSFLGYAQFPETDLEGTQPPYTATTDGVVIHYKAFGSIDDGAFNLVAKYNKGRTTTHEVGHYLGLIHIFGDYDGCSTTDFVSDTPVQSDRTFTCPSSPLTQCGHHVMFQNYLDYTDDACMNLFTAGQIARIETVLAESPRRASLLTSPGLNDPVVLDLDLEAKNVAAPFTITCGDGIVPKLVIRNRGENTITSAKISFSVNGDVIETKDIALNLVSLAETTINFNPIDLTEPSNNNISFDILEVNGTADEEPSNNSTSLVSQVKARLNAPLLEPFNSTPSGWEIVNSDNSTTWTNKTAPKSTSTNKAMFIDLYNYQNTSSKDLLISPFIDIPVTSALLRFDHAYAMFPNIDDERLRVLVSVGCSTDLADAVEIYNKSGADLATAPTQTTAFVPTGELQWESNGISLAAYNGQTVRFIFESTNENGNNLYLDNVQVSTGPLSDIRLVSILAPGPVFCESQPKPIIEVQNLGTQTVDALQITTTVNGVVNAVETVTGLAMTPGALETLTLESLNLTQANNTIGISVTNPEISDDTPGDNSVSVARIYNTVREVTPLRQNFDNGASNWTIYTEPDQQPWVGTATPGYYKNSLVYKGFTNANIGAESWFVSPVLDLTKTNQGSLYFSTSYGKRADHSERLKVLVSEDCGVTYNEMLFEKSGSELAKLESETSWTPIDTSQWKTEHFSLNDYAGKNNIRFAFVATNDNGNNLYLDNIEFYVQDDPKRPRSDEQIIVWNSLKNWYEFSVTFNLPEKQDARLIVYNSIGQLMIDSELPGALNQTYEVNLYGQSPGVYIVRLLTPSLTRTSKVSIGR